MAFGLHSVTDQLRWIARNTRRLVVTLVGFSILGAGLAMLVLPGPGIIVVLFGFAVLAREFTWAERALDKTATSAASATTKVTATKVGKLTLAASALSMIIGGGVVMFIYSEQKIVGASVTFAGIIALSTVLPAVQRWLNRKVSARERH
ncbi:MAG: hypothetical protein RL419_1338 [Actinomycetota bacterium]